MILHFLYNLCLRNQRKITLAFQCVDDVLTTEPHSSAGLENRRSLLQSRVPQIFFPRTDDIHCDRIHSSLTAVRCLMVKWESSQLLGKNSVRTAG